MAEGARTSKVVALDEHSVDVRRLLWRILFEQRLFRAVMGLSLALCVSAFMATGLMILRPTGELAMVEHFLRAHFSLDALASVADVAGVYDAMAQFSTSALRLRAADPELWCEARYRSVDWSETLGAPVATCSSPREHAMGVAGRPTWLAWQAGQTDGGGAVLAAADCADNLTALRIETQDASSTCQPQYGACDYSHTALHCRVSCGYCGPFVYEPVGRYTHRHLVPGNALSVQTRRKRGSCRAFSDRLNGLGQIHTPPIQGGPAPGHPANAFLDCPESGIAPGAEEDWRPEGLCADVMGKVPGCNGIGVAQTWDEHTVYPYIFGENPGGEVGRLKTLGWLDRLTDSVTLESLVYLEGSRIYSLVTVTFRFDEAGNVRANAAVRSHKEPLGYSTILLLFTFPLFLMFIAFVAVELLGEDAKEYIVASDNTRASRKAGGVALRAVKSVEGASEGWVKWGARVMAVEENAWLRVDKKLLVPMSLDGARVACVADARSGRRAAFLAEPLTFGFSCVALVTLMASWTSQPWLQVTYNDILQAVIDGTPPDQLADLLWKAGRKIDGVVTWMTSMRVICYLALLALGIQAILYLGVHPRTRMVTDAFSRCGSEALHALTGIFSILVLFAACACVAFGSGDESHFSTFGAAFSTQLRWLLGEPFFNSLPQPKMFLDGQWLDLWRVYALVFFFVASWGFVDLLAAILLDAVDEGGAQSGGDEVGFTYSICFDFWDCIKEQLLLRQRRRASLLSTLRVIPSRAAYSQATGSQAGPGGLWSVLGAAPAAQSVPVEDLRELSVDNLPSGMLDSILQRYDSKCPGVLTPPPLLKREGGPSDEVEELPFADIAHLDKRTNLQLRKRTETRTAALVQWGQANLETPLAWEQFAPAMACSIFQEVLTVLIDEQEEAAEIDPSWELSEQFFAKVGAVPYNVLGSRTLSSGAEEQAATEPTPDIAVVDFTSLLFVQGTGPRGAGAASGALYRWLGFAGDTEFSEDVRSTLQAELDVKLMCYAGSHVIHAVGPDLRSVLYKGAKRAAALRSLARIYSSVLEAFATTGCERLRIPPAGGGIFAGEYAEEIPALTKEALIGGFKMLKAEMQQKVLEAYRIELCLPQQAEYDQFLASVPSRSRDPKPYVNYVIHDYVPGIRPPVLTDPQNVDKYSDASSDSC